MYKKKKPNIVLRVLFVLFIIFIALFIANLSGYYESKIRSQVYITNESIKDFESKVQNGDDIDIMNFLDTSKDDYSSSVSKLGDSLTYSVENIVTGGMHFISNILKSLF